MDTWHVAAALLSALLHASWNAVVKASAHPREIMTAQMVMCAALVLPGLLWTGLPAPASWIWIAASTGLNLVTVTALLKAYDVLGFGATYPIVRALSVLLVVPLAALVSGEALSAYGLAGVALVATSLLLLAIDNVRGNLQPRTALLWVLLAGITTAAYVLCDAQGVRQAGSPWAYGFVVSITNAVAMSWLQGTLAAPWRAAAKHWATVVPIAVAAIASYLLILWVWTNAPIAPGAALRDMSAVFAIAIAILWLREPFTRLRLFAIMLAAVAVPLLRFA